MKRNEASARTVEHDEDGAIVTIETAAEVIARNEVQMQLDAAKRYPRSAKRFLATATERATLTVETAEGCMYALTRGGKTIAGKSVRLAEICAGAYGNLHVAARVIAAEDREVVAQGVAWDLETNLRVSVEVRRRITKKDGRRYDDDMIGVAGAAAGSIALRNAIFRVIPGAYTDEVYARAKSVAVGTATTLVQRRGEIVARLQKIGVPLERIFQRVGKAGIQDIGLDELELLVALGTAVKNGDRSIDEVFPAADTAPSKAKSLEDEITGAAAPSKAAEPTEAAKPA